jgi:TonB family protein
MNAPVNAMDLKASQPSNPSATEHVTEVVAMYKGHVLDVKHLGTADPRGRTRARVLLGLSAAAILGGLSLFTYEVAQPWDAYAAAAVEAQELSAAMPNKPGLGTGGLGLGLALLGLVPGVIGLGRLRLRDEDEYSIGESPEATFQVSGDGLPDAGSFTLVTHGDGRSDLNVLPTMPAQLTEAGRWAESQQNQGTVGLVDGAGAIVERGGVRFYVRRVPRERAEIAPGEVDRAFWGSVTGVGAVAAVAIGMMTMIPDDMMAFSLDEDHQNNRFARYLYQADIDREPEPTPVEPTEETEANEEAGGQGSRAPGDEGQAGDPKQQNTSGRYAIKRRANMLPQVARDWSPEMEARQAGILGVMAQSESSPFASPFGGAFAVGQDDENVWGNIMGPEVAAAYGTGGMGIIGTGRGGGGNASGLLGMGTQGLIGHGVNGGEGSGPGRGNGHTTRFTKREKRPPTVHIAKGDIDGSIDKSMVRRIVRAHINEVRACYNQGLTRNPNLFGRVSVQFLITGTGKVATASVGQNSMKDKNVGRCVAKAVKRWRFPRPAAGGSVIVNYPFTFAAS